MSSAVYYDPFDYAIDQNPYPVWERMREEAPLYWNEKYGFWAVSRFADVWSAYHNTETFSSTHGVSLDMMTDTATDMTYMMIFMDPPEHYNFRRLVSSPFAPKRIAALESMIQAYTNQYLDNLAGSKSFDYVQDFGAWLPPMVIGALVGVPESDRDMYRRWTDESLHIDEGQTGPSEKAQKARMEGGAYVWNMVQERRKNLGDDMISDLLQAEIDQDGEKRKLTDLEVVAFVQLLAGAGSETVARFLGFAGVELGRNPDQRKILIDDPSVIPNAVEELLRFEAPSPVNGRWVMHDTEINGTKIPKDSKILLINGSANRDPREYDEPEKLKVKREIKRHITFGYGPHFCLGASLARLEAKVALAETLKRYPNWEVDEAGLEMVRTTTVRGYAKVPITV